MSRIHTLSDIGEGNKLGDLPSNRYPPSRTELENLLNQANNNHEIAIEYKSIGNETIFNPEGLIYERIEIDYLRVELSALNSNLALKNSELERMKNMLTLKNGELELIKNDLAKKNSEIRSLETKLKELLPCNRLSSEQVKIRGKTDEKNDDNISVTQSSPKDLNSLSLAKYFVRKPKTENSQVDRDIQESLTQQTLTSLNEKQINNEQNKPEGSLLRNNNIPIREIEALPVVTLGAGEALEYFSSNQKGRKFLSSI
ncbi:hypothetical protein C2G38_2210653 [Gigaspora rosea]|uniref:Uncharacterized protein n=1 Tax=Gigaspora rosea TaxID=44941 RepID=A0A397UF71_9GLOM|nr:hypothetical protein C2G38_2210653 [Gigaspora rosea]